MTVSVPPNDPFPLVVMFPAVSKPPKVPVPGVAMFPFGAMEVSPPFVK